MSELRFSTEQIRAETNGMSALAAPFLSRKHSDRFRKAAYDLELALKSGGVWQIPEADPIETLESEGEAGALFGTLSFKWEVKKITSQTFSVSGNASTTLEIHNLGEAPSISWNTDIGGAGHPGYRFHMQIRANQKSMDIPRLPSLLLTPADCLDFLLGELFQKKWTMHQDQKRLETAGWTRGVRTRVCHLLRMKAECASKSSGITPWMTLKTWDLKNPRLTLADD
jgi:hypothetical protein